MRSRAQPQPTAYRPDLYRRFAELLVDGGLVTRREVELALREARRAQQPLAQWLIRNKRVPPRHMATLRRLETLLVRHPGSLRLADLLLESGEITRTQLRHLQETRTQSGQSIAEILSSQRLLNHGPQPPRPRTLMAGPFATVAVTTLATLCIWLILQARPELQPIHAANASMGAPPASPPTYADLGDDLRFASLGDITPHLQRLRQRPGPYRAPPPALTGSIRQRIKTLRPVVNQYARKYKLPPALILAVIEQESSFDSHAQSGQSGIGLMQLVPHEGGREAYHYVERRPGTPTPRELQDPKTNIRLGTAYMRLLLDRHFDDIENPDVRVAITLAAYNWGPTRMRRVLSRHGVPASLDEVDALLRKHAPTETQEYVREVTLRMDAYG